ncbi:MAG: DUF4926 domain-containing protein [Acutalibacteraceae bacterium]|nr:DUF4926 domain-containing protein [Acutalibacteraceae bacterium]
MSRINYTCQKYHLARIVTEETIVLEYEGSFFEVEFFDSDGDTIGVFTTPADMLEIASHN